MYVSIIRFVFVVFNVLLLSCGFLFVLCIHHHGFFECMENHFF
jgi:hypothetical protein